MGQPAEVLDTIELLYRAATEPDRWPEALQRFAVSCGGIGTAMIPITPGNTTGLLVSPDIAESRPEYDREWWQYDTRVQRIFSRKLTDGVCCEAELFTPDEIARDPMRNEFCRKHGMGSFAAQLVTPMPNFVVAFSVMRAWPRGQFEKHELKTLSLLGKHAARALLVSTRLATADRYRRAVTTALAQLDCAAYVVDRNLNLLLTNSAGEALHPDGIIIQHGRLSASAPQQHEALVRFLKQVMTSSPHEPELGPVALPRANGRPLLMQAIPVSDDSAVSGLPQRGAALVLIVDPDRKADRSVGEALRALGLTRAEARLANLIGAGKSRSEAAEALNISETTVSDTLKEVYSKLDVTRQSELVRLVDHLALLSQRRANEASA